MGRVIAGRYCIESLIAEGGFGQVFVAEHTQLGSRVALKLLRAVHAESGEVRGRFLREARVVAEMNHPHIVRIHDLGEHGNGELYLAMEYLDGDPLSGLMRRGELTETRLVDILGQAATALDFAHRRGVVHRDVKPPNIMVVPLDDAPDGRGRDYVKLIDFGILKRYETEHTPAGGRLDVEPTEQRVHTATAMVVGTPTYMAPEQVRRQAITGAADQFALAIIAYEVLTGRRPYRGQSAMEVMTARLQGPPPPIRELASGRPPPVGVNHVLRRAMALEPGDRFRTASEFVSALGEALDGGSDERAAASPRSGPATESLALEDTLPSGLLVDRRWWISLVLLLIAVGGAAILWAAGGSVEPPGSTPEPSLRGVEPIGTLGRPLVPDAPSDGAVPEMATDALVAVNPATRRRPSGSESRDVRRRFESQAPSAGPTNATLTSKRTRALPTAIANAGGRQPDRTPSRPVSPPPSRASTRPAADSTEATAPARLSISARPSGRIYVGGTFRGDGDVHALSLASGRHRVRAEDAQGRVVEASVRLRPGQKHKLKFKMGAGTWSFE